MGGTLETSLLGPGKGKGMVLIAVVQREGKKANNSKNTVYFFGPLK